MAAGFDASGAGAAVGFVAAAGFTAAAAAGFAAGAGATGFASAEAVGAGFVDAVAFGVGDGTAGSIKGAWEAGNSGALERTVTSTRTGAGSEAMAAVSTDGAGGRDSGIVGSGIVAATWADFGAS